MKPLLEKQNRGGGRAVQRVRQPTECTNTLCNKYEGTEKGGGGKGRTKGEKKDAIAWKTKKTFWFDGICVVVTCSELRCRIRHLLGHV